MIETKIKTDDVTLMGSQSTIQSIPETIPRFQLRLNNLKLRKDAFELGMQFDHLKTYLGVSDAKIFNTVNEVVEDFYDSSNFFEDHLFHENNALNF